jgi:hypothetical protein
MDARFGLRAFGNDAFRAFRALALGAVSLAAIGLQIAWPVYAIEEIADDGPLRGVATVALMLFASGGTFGLLLLAGRRSSFLPVARARLRRYAVPLSILAGAAAIAATLAIGNAAHVIENRDGYTRVNRLTGAATRCWTETAMREADGQLGWQPPGCVRVVP